jgi:hypothetical protein
MIEAPCATAVVKNEVHSSIEKEHYYKYNVVTRLLLLMLLLRSI